MNQSEFSELLHQKLEQDHSEGELDILFEEVTDQKNQESILGRFKSIFFWN